MLLRLAGLVIPAVLFVAVGPTAAQPRGGGPPHVGGGPYFAAPPIGGPHVGGVHVGGPHIGGVHPGGVYHGGYHQPTSYGYYGGNRYYGDNRGGYSGGFSYPFLGSSLGYGYGLGGFDYGYGLGGYGLGYGLGRGYYGGGYGYPYPSYGGFSYAMPAASAALGVPVVSGAYAPQPVPADGFGSVTPSEPAPASVTVVVPEGAELWFDGKDMGKAGGSQVFTSPVMQPGQTATLSVKVRWNGNTREMQLPIRAGDKMTVDLTRQ